MRTKVLLACLFVAGIAASFAIASPPPGKGHPHNGALTPTGSSMGTTTTSHGNGHAGKVALCHKTGSKWNPYVKIWVSKNSVKAHERRGDIAVSADGTCPKAKVHPGGGGTTTGTTTTSTP